MQTTAQARTLSAIAREVRQDWKNVSPYAAPYLQAMQTLQGIDDRYILDSACEIVQRFLCNAGGWRGETARRIKAELKAMTGQK